MMVKTIGMTKGRPGLTTTMHAKVHGILPKVLVTMGVTRMIRRTMETSLSMRGLGMDDD